jgi:hypothetical protein
MCWIYPKTIHQAMTIIRNNQNSQGYLLWVNSSNHISCQFPTLSNSAINPSSGNQIIANQWQHIATTYDGTNIHTYLNGQLEKTISSTGTISTDTSTPLFFSKGSGGIDGALDDIRIYNRALTEREIRLIYLSGED